MPVKKDYILFIFVIGLLIIIGFFAQYSTSINHDLDVFKKQMAFFLLSLPLMLFCFLFPIERIINNAYKIYFFAIFILLVVLIIGKTAMGATRWIAFGGMNLQPSELVKLIVIFALAAYFKNLRAYGSNNIIYFAVPIFIILLPAFLIFLQPNLGTSIIVTMIGSTMIFTLFARTKILYLCMFSILCTMPLIWNFILHDYQKQRVLTFLNPESDARGAGYNIIQSKIAIGSGQLFGRGYLEGKQSKLNFLPEQHTDFIFTVFAEEFGFILSSLLLFLYFYLILKIYHYAENINDVAEKLILIGCASLFFWHIFINIGMSMDLLPVVGIPLPLMSYGRSFFLVNIMILGIIFNIIKKNIILNKSYPQHIT